MHGYLFAYCKTPSCGAKHYLAHRELQVDSPEPTLLEYPDEWFPMTFPCPRCGRTHAYALKDIGAEVLPTSLHPSNWKPILPDSPVREKMN
jgi:hypothetical protein